LCSKGGQGERGINATVSSSRLCRESPLTPWRAPTLRAVAGDRLIIPGNCLTASAGSGAAPQGSCRPVCAHLYPRKHEKIPVCATGSPYSSAKIQSSHRASARSAQAPRSKERSLPTRSRLPAGSPADASMSTASNSINAQNAAISCPPQRDKPRSNVASRKAENSSLRTSTKHPGHPQILRKSRNRKLNRITCVARAQCGVWDRPASVYEVLGKYLRVVREGAGAWQPPVP